MRENNKPNRWIYLCIGTGILLFLGLIYAWSIFRVPLNKIYPNWTFSEISLTFTISMVSFCLGGFISSLLLRKISSKMLIPLAALVVAIGFFGVSWLSQGQEKTSLILLYVFYGVLGGLGVGISYNAVISTVSKWFPDRQGLASGIMMMGFGFGGILLGSIVQGLVGQVGLFMTFRYLSILILIVGISGGLILVDPPQKNGDAKEDSGSMETRDMVRTPTFWFFFLWLMIINSAGLLIINSAASITMAYGAPAILGLIVSVFNGGGRVLMGAVFDRAGRKKAMLMDIGFFLVASTALILGAFTGRVSLILCGLLFTGLGYGGAPTLSAAFTHKFFGAKNFSMNFSIMNFSLMPAAIIGPMVSSYLIEQNNGGFQGSFKMQEILGLSALILWIFINRLASSREK